MYQIFVGDKPIILTTKVDLETNFKNYLISSCNISKVIKDLKKKEIASVRLIGDRKDTLIKTFLKLLPNVVAGGGKVLNENGEVLFIYRNNKWDLPKGKAERNETIDKTAIREVEEETGVKGLKITKPLEMTYHIFKRNGRYRIKVTYWFEMKTNYNGQLTPQEKEGITKVEWLNKKQMKVALANSYANIKLLVCLQYALFGGSPRNELTRAQRGKTNTSLLWMRMHNAPVTTLCHKLTSLLDDHK